MTENEALEKHKEDCMRCKDKACMHGVDCLQKKDIEMYKEIQKYRAIGTIDEFKDLKEKNETLKALYYDARKEGTNLLANARAKATVELTDREREVLNTNLSAEIMKMQFHYGNSVPERLQVLYSLRDKLCHKEDKK